MRQLEAVAAVTADTVAVIEEVVADKGYHSRTTEHDLETPEIRTYISEPDRGRQSWTAQEAERIAVYANRRRVRGDRGQRLLRRRGELLERPCDTSLTRQVGSGEPTCAGTRTCLNDCSFLLAHSISAFGCGRSRCRHSAGPPGPQSGARRNDHRSVRVHGRREDCELGAASRSQAIRPSVVWVSRRRLGPVNNHDLCHGHLGRSNADRAAASPRVVSYRRARRERRRRPRA